MANSNQEWGQKFPQEKLTAAKDKSTLKRLAEIEVSMPGILPTRERNANLVISGCRRTDRVSGKTEVDDRTESHH